MIIKWWRWNILILFFIKKNTNKYTNINTRITKYITRYGTNHVCASTKLNVCLFKDEKNNDGAPWIHPRIQKQFIFTSIFIPSSEQFFCVLSTRSAYIFFLNSRRWNKKKYINCPCWFFYISLKETIIYIKKK